VNAVVELEEYEGVGLLKWVAIVT